MAVEKLTYLYRLDGTQVPPFDVTDYLGTYSNADFTVTLTGVQIGVLLTLLQLSMNREYWYLFPPVGWETVENALSGAINRLQGANI